MKHSLFRFRDGRVVSGTLLDELPLAPDAGALRASFPGEESPLEIPLTELKAVFILRPAEIADAGGEPVNLAVDFADGETLRGTTRGWLPGHPSFLLVPEDATKIEAVLVIAAALVGVEVEGGSQRRE